MNRTIRFAAFLIAMMLPATATRAESNTAVLTVDVTCFGCKEDTVLTVHAYGLQGEETRVVDASGRATFMSLAPGSLTVWVTGIRSFCDQSRLVTIHANLHSIVRAFAVAGADLCRGPLPASDTVQSGFTQDVYTIR